MKKIIFEQVGNIILSILLVIAMSQTSLNSKFDISDNALDIQLTFGSLWFVFMLAMVLFSFARFFYSRKYGKKEGYNTKQGEMSIVDEREKTVSLQASSITYQSMKYCLSIMMILVLYSNLFISSIQVIRMVSILAIGSCLIFLFSTYLISWIILDNKI